MKPEAPVEIRGEFKPIKTNVPGIDICELLPLQAKIADRFSIIRGFETNGSHDSRMLTTGFKPGLYRPAFGSVVSRLLPGESGGLPPYVTLVQESNLPFGQYPAYLGPAHAPFGLRGKGVADLTPPRHADRAKSKPFTPRNLLATLYHCSALMRQPPSRTILADPNSCSTIGTGSTSCCKCRTHMQKTTSRHLSGAEIS